MRHVDRQAQLCHGCNGRLMHNSSNELDDLESQRGHIRRRRKATGVGAPFVAAAFVEAERFPRGGGAGYAIASAGPSPMDWPYEPMCRWVSASRYGQRPANYRLLIQGLRMCQR